MPILRLRNAVCVAAAALAACSDLPTHSAEAGGTGPSTSTYVSTPTELGCCGSFTDVNNGGLLVGTRELNSQDRAAAYTPGTGFRYLQGLDSAYISPVAHAYGVNDAGQIVGQARDRNWVDRPVLWTSTNALPIDLGQLREGGYGTAWDVNAGGMVVGEAQKETYSSRAFYWTQGGGMVELPLPSGPSSAQAVNDSGQVVGGFTNENGQMRGYVWKAGSGRRTLPTLGGNASAAYDINNRGQVVGFASTPAGHVHAVLWPPEGGIVDLGTVNGPNSGATGINEHGVVVGWARDNNTIEHAFAWSPRTGMRLIADEGAFTVANGINRNGLVAGVKNSGYPVFWRITEANTRPTVAVTQGFATLNEGQPGVFTPWWTGHELPQYFRYDWDDAENDPLSSEWSFGDGTTLSFAPSLDENTVAKTYRDNGVYTVRLIVKDPSNTRDTLTAQITVLNVAPTGTFETPTRTLVEGQTYQLNARGIKDGPADLTAGIQASFSCGGAWSEYVTRGFTFACPALADNGSLQVGMRLRDKDGAVTEYLRTLTVQNAAPVVRVSAVSSRTVPINGTFTAGGAFTDAGAADGPWRYRYVWGDGTVTAGWVTAQGTVPEASHVYTAAGTYPVSLWITDKDGKTGQGAAITVTVGP